MREIKFRGLDVLTGSWVYGNLLTTAAGTYIIPQSLGVNFIQSYQVDKDTVGQCTGLKDRNGNEVYYDDIITYLDGYDTSTECGFDFTEFENRGIVEWDEEELRYFVTDRKTVDLESVWDSDNIEVIGNIHENPDKLEVPS